MCFRGYVLLLLCMKSLCKSFESFNKKLKPFMFNINYNYFVDWTAKDEDNSDISVSVWEDNWDDDDVEDDFNQQLRYLSSFLTFLKLLSSFKERI